MILVRLGLPLMLAVSATLHAGLVAGVVLVHFYWLHASDMALSATTTPTLILLRSENVPDLRHVASSRHAARSVVPKTFALGVLDNVAVETEMPVAAPASLALEANPNAHLRALETESVLSPRPAPNLNHANGIVFLLDVSGSMYEPYAGSTRLALARDMLSRRIRALPDGTPFAITIYAQTARTSGPLVVANAATREAAVRWIMEEFDCGGGTNLPGALVSAEELRPGHLVLVTDGDLNIKPSTLLTNANKILGPQGHGPALSIVGIGPRPATDAAHLLQGLAEQQGGTYHEESPVDAADQLTSNQTVDPTP